MLIKFPSIRQFREVIKEYRKLGYTGLVQLVGYPKVHGLNANLVFTGPNEFLVQHKENPATERDDPYGYWEWSESQRGYLLSIGRTWQAEFGLTYPFVVSGEWAGGNIQPKASTFGVEKFWAVFGVGRLDASGKIDWVDLENHYLTYPSARIFDVRDFGVRRLTLDVASPEAIQTRLAELTTEYESACPVAQYFGVKSDKGEGIVWHCEDNLDRHLWFKVKGHKHTSSKVRELAHITPEQLQSIEEFVEYAVTENRLEQALQTVGPAIRTNLTPFLKWLGNDILKEESDTLTTAGLTYKQVADRIGVKAIAWYRTKQTDLE